MSTKKVTELILKGETIASLEPITSPEQRRIYAGDMKPLPASWDDLCTMKCGTNYTYQCDTIEFDCTITGTTTGPGGSETGNQGTGVTGTPTCDTKPQHCPSLYTGCEYC